MEVTLLANEIEAYNDAELTKHIEVYGRSVVTVPIALYAADLNIQNNQSQGSRELHSRVH